MSDSTTPTADRADPASASPRALRLAINGRFLSRAPTGVDRFAGELVRALDGVLAAARSRGSGGLPQVELLLPSGCLPPSLAYIRERSLAGGPSQAWEQGALLRGAAGTFLLNLCNTAPVLKREQLVVIHDAATRRVPQAYGAAFRAWYGALLPVLGRTARCVATVSEFSRREIAGAFGIPARKIAVLPEGAEHLHRVLPDRSILQAHRLAGRPFLLAVSSVVAHKNFALIARALQACPPGASFDVAIAGGSNPRVFGEAGLADDPRIKWLGYVSDGQLRALYEAAAAFVFPSRYEGFGLPPLEAMSFGCPVICSSAASMPEVCGDAVLYIDPDDAGGLLRAMLRLLANPVLADQLRGKGLARAARWTWQRSAEALLSEVYRAHAVAPPAQLLGAAIPAAGGAPA